MLLDCALDGRGGRPLPAFATAFAIRAAARVNLLCVQRIATCRSKGSKRHGPNKVHGVELGRRASSRERGIQICRGAIPDQPVSMLAHFALILQHKAPCGQSPVGALSRQRSSRQGCGRTTCGSHPSNVLGAKAEPSASCEAFPM